MVRASNLVRVMNKPTHAKAVVDYVAIRRDILSIVLNCKVIPGELVAPQHRLLVIDLKIIKKRRIKKIRTKRINW